MKPMYIYSFADPLRELGMTTKSASAFCIASINFKIYLLTSWKTLLWSSSSILFSQYRSSTSSNGFSNVARLPSTLARSSIKSYFSSLRVCSTRKSDKMIRSKIIHLLLTSSPFTIASKRIKYSSFIDWSMSFSTCRRSRSRLSSAARVSTNFSDVCWNRRSSINCWYRCKLSSNSIQCLSTSRIWLCDMKLQMRSNRILLCDFRRDWHRR